MSTGHLHGDRHSPLTAADFQAATNVSRETMERLEIYAALLSKWTRSINLVSPSSLGDLWRRHFLDSAQLWPLLPPVPANRPRILVDLGSGGGFPGLVLAILGAGSVHLLESDGRKAVFLREVVRATETDATVHAERIERIQSFAADVVTARACAPLPRLLPMAAPFMVPPRSGHGGGIGLFMLGRMTRRELTDSLGTWNMRFDLHPSRTDPAAQILRLSHLGEGACRP